MIFFDIIFISHLILWMKEVFMKQNVFDQNKPRKINSKNNVFANFLQKSGLYDEIEVKRENVFHLIDLINGKVKIDEYCPSCGENRVFNMEPIVYYSESEFKDTYVSVLLADRLESLQKFGYGEIIRDEDNSTTLKWDWKNWEVANEVRIMVFKFACSMEASHRIDYIVATDGCKIKKIGQYPSVADLSFPELKEYRKILSKQDEKEFKRAIGLHAQGIGIGSFVYLRRIFERIIDAAKQKAISAGTLDEQTYKDAHVDERIKMLANYLPKTLVESTAFYGIVSKGIHELSEEDCIAYFPVLREFIFMILRQWEQLRKEEEAEKQIKESLNQIAANIKK